MQGARLSLSAACIFGCWLIIYAHVFLTPNDVGDCLKAFASSVSAASDQQYWEVHAGVSRGMIGGGNAAEHREQSLVLSFIYYTAAGDMALPARALKGACGHGSGV